MDYAWHSTGYPEWFINPGHQKGHVNRVNPAYTLEFGKPRLLADGLGQKEGAFTWDRQVAFLKSPNAKGANYFILFKPVSRKGTLKWPVQR